MFELCLPWSGVVSPIVEVRLNILIVHPTLKGKWDTTSCTGGAASSMQNISLKSTKRSNLLWESALWDGQLTQLMLYTLNKNWQPSSASGILAPWLAVVSMA